MTEKTGSTHDDDIPEDTHPIVDSWYDDGGSLPSGVTTASNDTDNPESVLPKHDPVPGVDFVERMCCPRKPCTHE